jgi:hypothetical protein
MESTTTFDTGTHPDGDRTLDCELNALRFPDTAFRIERCSRHRIAA